MHLFSRNFRRKGETSWSNPLPLFLLGVIVIYLALSATPTAAAGFSTAGNMNITRQYHTATLMQNGKILLTGGGVTSAELFDPSNGIYTMTGSMATTRSNHSATLLPNGKVLIAGGGNNPAELYDPNTNTFSPTGNMVIPRSNHTATLLTDGTVLIAGGGTSSAEIYNPVTGVFAATSGNMGITRSNATASLLTDGTVLIAGGGTNTADIYSPGSGNFTATSGNMATIRSNATATLLPNGKVLIAGGGTNSAVIYTPGSGTFTATTGSMSASRSSHKAVLLPNGKVLITGGNNGPTALNSSEIYDPASSNFTPGNNMLNERTYHTTTLLPDGRVFVVGGWNGSNSLASGEIYDYSAGASSAAGDMGTVRSNHTVTLLSNGTLLVAGGVNNGTTLNSAEIYDPSAGTYTATTGNMGTARKNFTATLLPNGKVLIVGGWDGTTGYNTAEIYNPATKTFAATGSMTTGRYYHTATLLHDGKVLITGGSNGLTGNTAEIYNPETGTFTLLSGRMTSKRVFHSATLLTNGKVLIAGGWDSGNGYLDSTELFNPANNSFTAAGSMNYIRFNHTATLLANGKVLIAGGDLNQGGTAELFNPNTGICTIITPLSTFRRFHCATLLHGGMVLISGGYNGTEAVSTMELYDPARGTFSATGPMGSERYLHTATLLPNGKVHLAGGWDGSDDLKSSELFDVGLGINDGRRPLISSITMPPTLPKRLQFSGIGFRGDSEASSGSSATSNTDFPLVQLQRIDNGQTTILGPDTNSNWTATDFTSATVYGLPNGYYLATLAANSLTSVAQIIRVASDINVSPTTVDYQNVNINSTSLPETFTISNNGAADLVISGITLWGGDSPMFTKLPGTCGSLPATIIPGSNCTVIVTFTPTSLGGKSATLSIMSNDPDSLTTDIPLTGTGVLITYTLSLDFIGNGTGTVNYSTGGNCTVDCDKNFNSDTTVALNATPDSTSQFDGWSGCDTIDNGACIITMTSARIASANFNLDVTAPTSSITAPANNAVLKGVNTIITGAASDSGSGLQQVEISFNNGSTWQTATGTSPWSYTWTLPSDGLTSILVRSLDKAGNYQNPPLNISVRIDNTEPNTAITAPVAGAALRGSSYTVTGTASDSGSGVSKVEISTNGGATWNLPTGTTNWSYTWTLPVDGPAVVLARTTDAAGNLQSVPTSVAVTVDNTPPTSTITAPPGGTILIGSTATIIGNASDGTGSGINKVEVSADNGVTWVTANGTTSWNYVWTLPADGNHTLKVRAIDNANNIQAVPSTVALIVNNNAPTSTFVAPASSSTIKGVTTNITGTAASSGSGVQKVELSFNGGSTWVLATGTTSWSYNWTLPADGNYTIYARAVDFGGLVQTTPAQVTFSIDNTLPNAIIATPTNLTMLRGAGVNISGTATDSGSGVQRVEVSIDGGTTWVTSTGTTSWNYFWNFSTNGTFNIKVRAVDAVNNVQSPEASISVTVDITNPVAVINSPADTSYLRGSSTIISGTATDTGTGLQRVEISLDNGSNWSSVTGTSSWNYNWTLPADGIYTITVRAVDNAGNIQSPVTSSTVIVDNTLPVTSITSQPTPYLNSASATFSFSASEPNVSYSCRLDDGSYISCSNPYTISGLANRSHTITVRATDAAGNVDPNPPSISWITDTVRPAVVTITPTDSATLVNTNTSLSVTFSEPIDPASINNSTFTVNNGVTGTVSYNNTTYTATFTPSTSLAYNKSYTASVNTGIKDLAGNTLASTTSWSFLTNPDGDVDGNGIVDITDALQALMIAVGRKTPSAAEIQRGDVAPLRSGKPATDGRIDVADALIILKKVVGLITW